MRQVIEVVKVFLCKVKLLSLSILTLDIAVVTKFATGQELVMRPDDEHVVWLDGREVQEAMVGRHPDGQLVYWQSIFAGKHWSL